MQRLLFFLWQQVRSKKGENMIVLKCDNCKKETEMAFEISINQRPYTVTDMFKKRTTQAHYDKEQVSL